jgi:hypothetical protein
LFWWGESFGFVLTFKTFFVLCCETLDLKLGLEKKTRNKIVNHQTQNKANKKIQAGRKH